MTNRNIKSVLRRLAAIRGTENPSPKRSVAIPAQKISEEFELTPLQILKNIPEHICVLNVQGVWQPVSSGNTAFFRSIQCLNFVQWVNEIIHVQDRVSVLKAVSDCRAHGLEKIVDFRVLDLSQAKDSPLWLELRCVPSEGSETILTQLRDISERKSLEKHLTETREVADQSNTAKSRFLANMSHELRTPLNAIIGFSDLLKSGLISEDDTDKHQEYQGLINQSAHHLLHVLNDILDMSKIEAGKYEIFPEEIDINLLIRSTSKILVPMAQKSQIKLNTADALDELIVEADAKAVRQIILNLVSNSIKFADQGSAIDISAQRIGKKIELRVKDEGRGIPPEKLDGLGDPFFQVDSEKSREHEGAGLGLSIVKGLVDLHGGDLDIQSTVDKGTTVSIKLSQTTKDRAPVPANDSDTIIRIRPQAGKNESVQIAKSRLAG